MRSAVAKLLGALQALLAVAFLATAASTAIKASGLGLVEFAQLAFMIAIGAWFAKLAIANFRAPPKDQPPPKDQAPPAP